jgi:hypothetical protein
VTGGERLVVGERFEGPPGCANGGYVCGLLAAHMAPGPLRITLRRPVPLGRQLSLAAIGRDQLALVQAESPYAVLVADEGGVEGAVTDAAPHGQVLVEAIASSSVDVGDVPQVGLEDARTAEPDEEILREHPFPRCFGCGPQRDPDEAVALHVRRLDGDVWAAAWTPGEGLPHGDDGQLTPEVAWTVLDCPSSFAAIPAGSPPHVLGRLEGWVHGMLSAGEELIVLAWPLGHEGRKRWGATAILGAGGDVRAVARATWIALA